MVPRRPDHLGKALTKRTQCPLDVGGSIGHIATDNQPIPVRLRLKLGDYLAIRGMVNVQVADRK